MRRNNHRLNLQQKLPASLIGRFGRLQGGRQKLWYWHPTSIFSEKGKIRLPYCPNLWTSGHKSPHSTCAPPNRPDQPGFRRSFSQKLRVNFWKIKEESEKFLQSVNHYFEGFSRSQIKQRIIKASYVCKDTTIPYEPIDWKSQWILAAEASIFGA